MSTDLLFVTQIASLLTFLGTVFVLYRLLVKQKDATIEVLKERQAYLQDRLTNESADVLQERQSKRIKLLQDELTRLGADSEANAELIQRKTEELVEAKRQFEPLQRFALDASGMSMSYFCPVCDEPTLESAEVKTTFSPRRVHHFRVAYQCGHVVKDGKVESQCRKT